jgi:hypothetical protein
MKSWLKARLTYANVVATLALIVAVAGGGTAIALSVGKNSVTTKSIKPGNVTARDLAGARVATALGSGTSSGTTVSCLPSERMLAGGAEARSTTTPPGEDRFLTASHPTPDGSGWTARADSGVVVYVVCLRAKPGK